MGHCSRDALSLLPTVAHLSLHSSIIQIISTNARMSLINICCEHYIEPCFIFNHLHFQFYFLQSSAALHLILNCPAACSTAVAAAAAAAVTAGTCCSHSQPLQIMLTLTICNKPGFSNIQQQTGNIKINNNVSQPQCQM